MVAKAPYNQSVDCRPTLTDREVIDFCRTGFLLLPGVVDAQTNRRTVEYLDERDDTYEPTPIMAEPWFVEGVLKNPAAAGAVRSLLGANFTLPAIISNHRGALPWPSAGGWHRDGGSIYGPGLDHLQVFYYPEECTEAMGPTEVLPGSHLMRTKANMMAHYGTIRGSVSSASPAGSIFLTVYEIWHRRRRATVGPQGKSRFRNLLKYNYWRTAPPRRDWVQEEGLDFNTINFNPPAGVFEQFQGGMGAAAMFCWLCGIDQQYQRRGGQCWPVANTVRDGTNQMGVPQALRNLQRSGI